jgi:predicted NUDIX family NTP pyrophosphohydrolase
MAKRSAGLLLFRHRQGGLEVLLAHPGGPFSRRKDEGAWSIPKGEYADDEQPLAAAQREFAEETGAAVTGNFLPLGEVRQASGKIVTAWALEGDFDPSALRSNTFSMEWPPGSGKQNEFPEVDRAAWFSIEAAGRRILKAQHQFLDRLVAIVRTPP